jgi:hypothetical protein
MESKEPKENDLVLLRLPCPYGYTNTWWRVMFIDLDKTFVGRLERFNRCEFEPMKDSKFHVDKILAIYNEGEQFCYSDNVSICECKGLCKDK